MPNTQLQSLELLEQLGFATTASVTAKALQQPARFKVRVIYRGHVERQAYSANGTDILLPSGQPHSAAACALMCTTQSVSIRDRW
jgi:hypothetical protein